jgi:hypothetical protein
MTAAKHPPNAARRTYLWHGQGVVAKAPPYLLERVADSTLPDETLTPLERAGAAVAQRRGAGPGRRAGRDKAGAARRGPSTREMSRLVVRDVPARGARSHRGLIAPPETLERATGAYADASPIDQVAVGPPGSMA